MKPRDAATSGGGILGGLDDEFAAEISVALDRIGSAHAAFPAWPGTQVRGLLIRKSPVQRFPYVIAFEEHERHLLVLAVGHSKRRPLYWLTRTEP